MRLVVADDAGNLEALLESRQYLCARDIGFDTQFFLNSPDARGDEI
jgi:hypothetical protein